jgi:hypothetical protein
VTRSILLLRHGARTIELSAGEQCLIGRDPSAQVRFDDDRVHRQLAIVSAADDSWTVVNVGRWLVVQLARRDGTGRDEVRPGESRTVGWSATELAVTLGDGERHALEIELTAQHADAATLTLPSDGPETAAGELRPGTGYFRALVALAEPRLTGRLATPTDAQIALRLNRSGRELRRVGAKTVERRLDYCRERLGLKGSPAEWDSNRNARDVLAEVAVAAGVVRPHDLAELEPEHAEGDG